LHKISALRSFKKWKVDLVIESIICEGKLRPCLGSHLEFDIKNADARRGKRRQVGRFSGHVIEGKPEPTPFPA
jgi:hypothetical protein